MKTPTAWLVLLLALGGASVTIAVEAKRAAEQDRGLAKAKQERQSLRRLQEENRKLLGQQPTAEEVRRLQDEGAEARALQARVKALRNSLAEKGEDGAKSQTPAAQWTYTGRESPRGSFESVLWAASHADVDRLAGLLDFAEGAGPVADALFANLPPAARQEYGSAQKVIATLLAGNFPKDAAAMTNLGESVTGNDAQLSFRIDHADGTSRTNLYKFRRSGDGWRLLVPASVMADYEKTLAGAPVSADGPNP
jgi:hypothetical protein